VELPGARWVHLRCDSCNRRRPQREPRSRPEEDRKRRKKNRDPEAYRASVLSDAGIMSCMSPAGGNLPFGRRVKKGLTRRYSNSMPRRGKKGKEREAPFRV